MKCYICKKFIYCNNCTAFKSCIHEYDKHGQFPKVVKVQSGNGITFVHVCSSKCSNDILLETSQRSMYYHLFV